MSRDTGKVTSSDTSNEATSDTTNHHVSNNQTIPQSRQQLIELCIAEGRLSSTDAAHFRKFCELLAAYYHFEFYQIEEALKVNYAPFNPDANPLLSQSVDAAQRAHMESALLDLLTQTLQRANYRTLDWVAIQQAVRQADLVDIKTEIDFHDYEQLLLFYRGEADSSGSRQKLLWKQQIKMKLYSNVILGLKFKEKEYFVKSGRKLDRLTFRPGSIYLYLYKDIPQNDLELLFPNVQLYMNWFDRVLFVVPALGAGISMLIKIVPNMLLLLGVISFLLFGPAFSEQLGVTESQIHDASPVLFAFTSVLLALGGFAYKQYDSYKNKRILFMKNVTETLFFRNLANNSSVFHSIVDVAEEEECKEAILIYYHLLIHNRSLSQAQLSQSIQEWLARCCNVQSEFDTRKVFARLQQIAAEIIPPGAVQPRTVSLLRLDSNQLCHIPPLIEAKMVIDKLWDSAYHVL